MHHGIETGTEVGVRGRCSSVAHNVLEPRHFGFHYSHRFENREGFFPQGASPFKIRLLGKHLDPQRLGKRYRSTIGVFLAGDDSEDGGLSGSISADKSDVLTGINLEGDVFEHLVRPIGLMDLIESYQHCFTTWKGLRRNVLSAGPPNRALI